MHEPQRSVTLFDPSGTAHSFNALDGLVAAARAQERAVHVVSGRPPAGSDSECVTWTGAEVATVINDRASRRAQRRALLEAMAGDASDVFCDMGLGRTLTSRGRTVPADPATVFIAHQTNVIDERRNTAARHRYMAKNQRELRRIAERGAQFLVHTPGTRQRLAEFVPAPQIHTQGWPVVSGADPCLGPDWRPRPEQVTVLFAGSARIQKGLLTLLEAAAKVPGFDRLIVPGRIAPNVRSRLEVDDERVELWDRWLEPAEYREVFAGASLVALPYRHWYETHGTYSSVLGEAMATGRPMLVSRALERLLPDGYGGAAVVDAESVDSVRSGLIDALENLDALDRSAMLDGRAHIAAHHTYEQYLDAIAAAAG